MSEAITYAEIQRLAGLIRVGAAGKKFLSDIELSESDMDLIRCNIGRIVTWPERSIDVDVVTAYAIVDVGVRCYSTSLWIPFNEVCSSTGAVCDTSAVSFHKEIKNRFRTVILEELGLDPYVDTPNDREWILIQCFVPNSDLDGFFRFCYKYCHEILSLETDGLDEQFVHLAEFINAFMEGRREEFVEEYGEDLPNPFSLDACVRHMLTNPNLFSEKMESMMFLIIDSEYSVRQSDYDLPSRIIDAYRDWYYDQYVRTGKRATRPKDAHRPRLALRRDGSTALYIPKGTYLLDACLVVRLNGIDVQGIRQPDFHEIRGLCKKNLKDSFYLPLDSIGKDGIRPFDNFTVSVGSKGARYRSGPNRRFILFSSNMIETDHFSSGYNWVLFRDQQEFDPMDCIVEDYGLIIKVFVQDGNVVSVCGIQQKVGGIAMRENAITYKADKMLQARFVDSDIVTDPEIPISLEMKNRKSKPVIHIEISDRDPISFIVDNKAQVHDYYRSGRHLEFILNLDDFSIGTSEVNIRVNESETTICKTKFIYLRGLKPVFDRSCYMDVQSGSLSLGDGRVLDFETIDIADPAVHWNETIAGEDIDISASIPVILLNYSNRWLGPGSYDTRLSDMDRRMRMYVGSDMSIGLYPLGSSRKASNRIQSSITGQGYRVFDLGDFIDEMKSKQGGKYSLYVSIDSTTKRLLAHIYTHNRYLVDTDSEMIMMENLSGNEGRAEVFKGTRFMKAFDLHDGENSYHDISSSGNILKIKERSFGSDIFDVQIESDYKIGDSIWYQPMDAGFVLHHGSDNPVLFDSEPGDMLSIRKEIEIKRKFNPWMREPGLLKDLEAMFKRDKV